MTNTHLEKWVPPTTTTDLQAFEAGLLSELDRYRQERDTPAKYVSPVTQSEVQPMQVGAIVRPVIALAGAAGAVYVMAVAAVSVGAVVASFVAANAGIIVAGAVVAGLCSSLFVRGGSEPEKVGPDNIGEWEYYQEQRQGWRKKQKMK